MYLQLMESKTKTEANSQLQNQLTITGKMKLVLIFHSSWKPAGQDMMSWIILQWNNKIHGWGPAGNCL